MKKFLSFLLCLAIFGSVVYGATRTSGYTEYKKLRLTDNGSASTPAIIQVDDVDTGIYFDGSASVLISSGGSNVATFGSSTQTVPVDLTVSSATTNKPVVTIKNTNADATPNYLVFQKDSASPTPNDVINKMQWKSDDASGNVTTIAEIEVQIEDVTSANEDASISIKTIKAATLTETLRLESGDVTMPGGSLTLSGGDLTVTSGVTDKPDIKYSNTNADATGISVTLDKNSVSPADNDKIAETIWTGNDSGGTSTTFAEIEVQTEDITDTTEDGSMSMQVVIDGNLTEVLRFENDYAVLGVTTSNATITTGNVNFKIMDNATGTVYYLKAHTSE